MLDFILKPGWKLEYQDSAVHCQSLKETRISTTAEKGVENSLVSKGFDQLERASANSVEVNRGHELKNIAKLARLHAIMRLTWFREVKMSKYFC